MYLFQLKLSFNILKSRLVNPTIVTTRTFSTVVDDFCLPQCGLKSKTQEKNKTALLFPGQGTQFVGMGRDLYNQHTCAQEVIDEVDETLGFKLSNIMFEGDKIKLDQAENNLPAILVTSISTLRVLKKEFGLDVKKDAHYALGHSLGEFSALVATEALSLKEAARILYNSGIEMKKYVDSMSKKTVMSTLLIKKGTLNELIEAMDRIKGILSDGETAELASINSSFQIVLSGTEKGVDKANEFLLDCQIALRIVDVTDSLPFHSSLMSPVSYSVKDSLYKNQFNTPNIPLILNTTAISFAPGEIDPSALLRNNILQQIDNTVQWFQSIENCRDLGVNQFIVFGPNKTLGNLIGRDYPYDKIRFATSLEDYHKGYMTKRTPIKSDSGSEDNTKKSSSSWSRNWFSNSEL